MLQIPDHPYIVLIIIGSVSGKTNSLFNVIIRQPYIDKMYLYAEDPCKATHQCLSNKQNSTALEAFKWF